MRKKSRKALGPVIASIILIAVTVAVSLAVAAWMGALAFGFMGSSSLTISKVAFTDVNGVVNNGSGVATNRLILTLKNTGTKEVTLSQIRVNKVIETFDTTNATLKPGANNMLLAIYNVGWSNGNPYEIDLYDSSGTGIGSTQLNAPGT